MRQAREERGLSQAALAEELTSLLKRKDDSGRWWPQAVSEAENGRRAFTAEELYALSITLWHPVAWFFELPPSEDILDLGPHRFTDWGSEVDVPLEERLVRDLTRATEALADYVRKKQEENVSLKSILEDLERREARAKEE
jgi:transcriptional regulator with XRE-family HTH domain